MLVIVENAGKAIIIVELSTESACAVELVAQLKSENEEDGQDKVDNTHTLTERAFDGGHLPRQQLPMTPP